MAETTTPATDGQEGASPLLVGGDNPPSAEAPTETDWQAEAKKWEKRAKSNHAAAQRVPELEKAAARLAEIEEAAKSEEQKRAEAAEKQAAEVARLQAKVAEYEAREQIAAWKAEVSEETGVPASVLAGSTREEIAAHAEVIKPLITQSAAPQKPDYSAIPAPGGGAVPLNSDVLEADLRRAVGASPK